MFKDIFLDAPNLGDKEKDRLMKCLCSTYVSTAGPFVPEFERSFARFLRVPNAVSVQSGTAALHVSLYDAGIKAGD